MTPSGTGCASFTGDQSTKPLYWSTIYQEYNTFHDLSINRYDIIKVLNCGMEVGGTYPMMYQCVYYIHKFQYTYQYSPICMCIYHIYIHKFIIVSYYLFLSPFVCLSVYLFVCWPVCLAVYLYICLYVDCCLFLIIVLFENLSICLSLYHLNIPHYPSL